MGFRIDFLGVWELNYSVMKEIFPRNRRKLYSEQVDDTIFICYQTYFSIAVFNRTLWDSLNSFWIRDCVVVNHMNRFWILPVIIFWPTDATCFFWRIVESPPRMTVLPFWQECWWKTILVLRQFCSLWPQRSPAPIGITSSNAHFRKKHWLAPLPRHW